MWAHVPVDVDYLLSPNSFPRKSFSFRDNLKTVQKTCNKLICRDLFFYQTKKYWKLLTHGPSTCREISQVVFLRDFHQLDLKSMQNPYVLVHFQVELVKSWWKWYFEPVWGDFRMLKHRLRRVFNIFWFGKKISARNELYSRNFQSIGGVRKHWRKTQEQKTHLWS